MGWIEHNVKDEKLRARIKAALADAEVFRKELGSSASIEKITAVPKMKPRLRQSHKPLLNKLETEYFNLVHNLYPNYPPVRAQAKTFRLANGVRFTPDLSCSLWPVDGKPSQETCWEIKGPHSWDDALVKIKMAAHEFPEICWRFVWKEKGEWREQIVLP